MCVQDIGLLLAKIDIMKIPTDKVKHFITCAVVALIASVAESALGAEYHNAWLAGVIAGMAIGVGKEYGDYCFLGEKWDWSDIGMDSIGSIVGATIGSMLSLLKN